MTRLTFLSAAGNRPLVKTFVDGAVKSYPHVKRVTSHIEEVQDLGEFEAALRKHSDAGNCLLKGQLDEPLENESRKGKIDRDTPTAYLVIDFDNIAIEGEMPSLAAAAEFLVMHLPEQFRTASYIAQASASFGRRTDRIALHLFFLLTAPAHPRALKEYMTQLNLENEFFASRMGLSATGTALSFPIDRTVADNSRLIYIAPPVFAGTETDPMAGQDRILLMAKTTERLDLGEQLSALNMEKIANDSRKKIRELRANQGLKNRKELTRTLTIDNQQVMVVINPDRIRLTYAEDDEEYVRYNVNDGDSNAYWVHKHNPLVVYNFKGEPNFLFEKADPETFAWHREAYSFDSLTTEEGLKPLIFLDYSSAKYHYGLYNPTTDRMESIYPCSAGDLKHFVAQYGAMMPETVPVWEYEFQPDRETVIDFDERFLNRYEMPDILRNPAEIPEGFVGIRMGEAADHIEQLCPTIHKIIMSVCGDGEIEYEYFINWLAFIVQRREKTMTAWVFHGVPGTGKGLLYNYILAPLIGEAYAKMKRPQDLEEKFNQWMQQTLLFVVDEFRLDDRNRQSDMLNKIKNIITERVGTIRSMGIDQREARLYANVLFFSNDHDAIRIQEGDRRFNIAPRQETPIIKRHPEILKDNAVTQLCREELPAFASFMLSYQIDDMAVMLPLENQAKAEMREASSDSIDLFVEAVSRGDLDYFVPVLDEPYRIGGEEYTLAAKNIIKALLRDYNPEEDTRMFVSELRPLYNVLCGKAENEHKFSKMLSRHGLRAERLRRGLTNKRGIRVKWRLQHNDINDLYTQYFNEAELAPKKTVFTSV